MIAHKRFEPSRISPAAPVVDMANQAGFIRAMFEGADGIALIQAQLNRLHADVTDAAAYMTLGTLYQLIGRREEALACQDAGLLHARLYRQAPSDGAPATLRLLVFVTRGDLMTNTPIELLLEGRPVEIIRLYVDPDLPLPDEVPDHDIAMTAIGEADETRPMLERLRDLARDWPRPLINPAGPILDLSRDRVWARLKGTPGVVLPPTVRAPRAAAAAVALGMRPLGALLPEGDFPVLVRPVGSHAGKGLARVDEVDELQSYLDANEAPVLYLSRFIDYASADDHYRKYRVAVFDGRPHLAHMAVGDHWMVHYLNAGMGQSPVKRAEEQAAMAGFADGFAARHAEALQEIARRLDLDYFALDCAETPDGALLVFEADVSMIVHALDPVDVYPYKQAHMHALFAAFEAMLRGKA